MLLIFEKKNLYTNPILNIFGRMLIQITTFPGCPPMILHDRRYSKALDKVNSFAEFFDSVCQSDTVEENHFKDGKETLNKLISGLDGIRSFLVTNCIVVLAELFKTIFYLSIRIKIFLER